MDQNEINLLNQKLKTDIEAIKLVKSYPQDKEFRNLFENFSQSLVEESYKLNRLAGVSKEKLLESVFINKNESPKKMAQDKLNVIKQKLSEKANIDKKLAESLIKPNLSNKILLENYFINDNLDESNLGIRLQKMLVNTLIENILAI